MAVEPELEELSLHEHILRAGPAVDTAIAAAQGSYMDYGTLAEVQAPQGRLARDAAFHRHRAARTCLDPEHRGAPIQIGSHEDLMSAWQVGRVLGALGTKRPPFTRADVGLLLSMAAHALRGAGVHDNWIDVSLAGQPVAAAERAVKRGGVGELREPIKALADNVGRVQAYGATTAARYRARLLALLSPVPTLTLVIDGGAEPVVVSAPVEPSLVDVADGWGQAWRARLATFTPAQAAMFTHCSLASGVVPSAAWRKRAAELVAADDARDMLHGMLDDTMVAAHNQTFRIYHYDGRDYKAWNPALVDANVVLVRGALWAAAAVDEAWVDAILLDIGLHFGTSGGSSNEVRDERLANSAAAALGSRAGSDAIGALGRMKAIIGNRNVSKQIAKALDVAAERAGISPSELLELAVPSYGLDEHGRLEIEVAEHVAVATIEGDDVRLAWRAPDGRETATVPAAIADQKAPVARAKDQVKELRKALGLERGRIEDLFTEDREWAVPDWRVRYLDHPLTGSIGRRLIWTVVRDGASTTAIPDGDGFVAADGSPVDIGEDDRIRLWHPIDAAEAGIAAWRTGLLERQVRQPFKQAFREVYVLTPAEEETERYSNRFAGHILRYPQARALMTGRRWGSNFLGPYDGGYNGIAKREFKSHAIRAEFWHDAIEQELQGFMGSVEHCTTDQVRFVRQGRVDDLLRLAEVPAIVFSEAMRDVDLFVSVTSIGADYVWPEGGAERRDPLGAYWRGAWTCRSPDRPRRGATRWRA